MTAQQAPAKAERPVPRPLIKTFWAIHRAIVRASSGRIGLQQPERGAKFGMLRLHTVGRKSGRERIAMIGYFEDGPNLVTLAMNGWGRAQPAWWLNLQAGGAATVELPDGTRQVRGRAASGEERERLWATFRDYPGWGSDLAALAAHRPGETAIVVLESTAGAERCVVAAIASIAFWMRLSSNSRSCPREPSTGGNSDANFLMVVTLLMLSSLCRSSIAP